MGNEKSRFLKRDDGTIYDSLTSVTWMANDSRLDMDKEVSYAETEEYLKKINEKKLVAMMTGASRPFMRRHPFMIRKS